MTKRQMELIKDNLSAYKANFEEPLIEKADSGSGFYVYRNQQEYEQGNSWVQYCYNIDYLNGWLYGAVQGIHQLRKKENAPAE